MTQMDGTKAGKILATLGYVSIWIVLSGLVIVYNKYLLSSYGFPFPITLTLYHMIFCSIIGFVIVRSGLVPSLDFDAQRYCKQVLPIGALYAASLWMSNAVYIYLSISFIQMLKGGMPVLVFSLGCLYGTEKFSREKLLNVIAIACGVAIASIGEINFGWFGFFLQMASLVVEALRLLLMQALLQSRGVVMNPITTVYYVSPAAALCLLLPFVVRELPVLLHTSNIPFSIPLFLGNGIAAFALNLGVFLLLGKTSALSMNVAGVVKDLCLIGVSFLVFKAPVSGVSMSGFLLAAGGVAFYNYRKVQVRCLFMSRSRCVACSCPGPGALLVHVQVQVQVRCLFMSRSRCVACSCPGPGALLVHVQVQVRCLFMSRSRCVACSCPGPGASLVHVQVPVRCLFMSRSWCVACSCPGPGALLVHVQVQVRCLFMSRSRCVACSCPGPGAFPVHVQVEVRCLFMSRSRCVACSCPGPGALPVHVQVQVRCLFMSRSRCVACSCPGPGPGALLVHVQVQVRCLFMSRSRCVACSCPGPGASLVHVQVQVRFLFMSRSRCVAC
eukprot:jgi/Mesvir1/22518/Mv18543-RA.1